MSKLNLQILGSNTVIPLTDNTFMRYLDEQKSSYITEHIENRKFDINFCEIVNNENLNKLETMREYCIKQYLKQLEDYYQAMSDEEGCGPVFAEIRMMNIHYVT